MPTAPTQKVPPMSRREVLRAQYIQAWYNMDLDRLVQATRQDYQFDDPAAPRPVTREGLAGYMQRWHDHAQGMNEWILEHEVRQDRDGILTDWHWWGVVGTDLTGAAVLKTSDDGVFLERICYFERGA